MTDVRTSLRVSVNGTGSPNPQNTTEPSSPEPRTVTESRFPTSLNVSKTQGNDDDDGGATPVNPKASANAVSASPETVPPNGSSDSLPLKVPLPTSPPVLGSRDSVSSIPPSLSSSETLASSAESQTATSLGSLDALLSPTDPDKHFPVRESVAASDVAVDEERFSTVLLSARQSLATEDEGLGTVDETGENEDTVGHLHDFQKHKKTASNSTILSVNNVPYFSSDGANRSRPNSLEVQKEFSKRYSGEGHRDTEESEAEAVDWDFWGQVVSDYQQFASQNPEQLAKAIEGGIPKNVRGMIWQLMTASKDPELEKTYLQLLKEQSPHEKAILRDLGRTFPHHAFFTEGQGIGQENLFNVLKAYSLFDQQVGYCQGLPFVVAILLLNMPDEEAFCLLVRLMHSYDLRGHFLPEMPSLQMRLFQFERLLEEVLPVLHIHFVRQGIKASMYASQWFLTMFSYRFPMDIVFRIYDNCFASGIEVLFSFSMALLSKNEPTLLSMKFDQLPAFLNTRIFDVYQVPRQEEGQEARYRVNEFVQDAMSFRITPFVLDNYAHEYEELVRARDAHKIEMENLRNTNKALVSQVKSIETSLGNLEKEHVQVLNELVRARLRHEELESELVRYKLLYAEAMHQSEDALSSHRISMTSRRGSSQSSMHA